MSEQNAAGGNDESVPAVGDVRFEHGLMLTFDGTAWLPVERIADNGEFQINRMISPSADSRAGADRGAAAADPSADADTSAGE